MTTSAPLDNPNTDPTVADLGAIELRDLSVRFGATVAVDGLTTTIAPGAIVGLLGRNGAGKSTLLRTLAAYRRPTSGTIHIGGDDPYENERLMAELCLVRHDGDFNGDLSINDTIAIAAAFRPRWDASVLERLLDRFEIRPSRQKVGTLSLGQRAALAVSIGLATNAAITMFDEPHLGLDAPSRYAFYDELLASYLANRRTMIVSTHLIDEMAALFEDVVIIDRGALVLHQSADELRTLGAEFTGPRTAVDALTADMHVLSTRSLGDTTAAVVYAEFDDDVHRRAAATGVDVGPIPLQDLFVALTTQESTR